MTVTIPLWMLIAFGAFASAVFVYFVGNVRGYDAGVRDTEVRWANAVARRDDEEGLR